jgi:hypothetical protein
MFSVPGRYGGGEAERYAWTQTLHEVEIKAPLPSGPPARSVKCTFTARRLDLSFEAPSSAEVEPVEPVAVGEVSAVIVASDCLWSVERDDAGGAVAVISLRKAVPAVWDRLFASDPAPTEPPALPVQGGAS